MESKVSPQDLDIKDYRTAIPEYMFHGDPERFKMIDKYFGWKIHLNVLPKNVEEVSEFLKNHAYTHKYLNTGNDETKSGKIFTVYFGPKELAEESIRDISFGIGSLLIPPIQTRAEQLVAPNIIARFDTDPNSKRFNPQFSRHGYYKGIPLLNYNDDDDLEGSIEQSSRVLTLAFGDFFGGKLAQAVSSRNKSVKIAPYGLISRDNRSVSEIVKFWHRICGSW